MPASRLLLVILAMALACSGCIRKPAPRPIAGAPAAAPAIAEPAPVPPPVVMAPPAEPMMMAEPDIEPAYTLDAGDKLRVVVFGQDGLSNSYAVDAAGNITMPLIGAVAARAQ